MKSTSLLLSSEAPCTAPAEQPITYDGESAASITSATDGNSLMDYDPDGSNKPIHVGQ